MRLKHIDVEFHQNTYKYLVGPLAAHRTEKAQISLTNSK